MRLTSFHSQFRNVGVNYNQIVKILYTHFSEKKAASFQYTLEKRTVEMIEIFKNVIKITEEFHKKNLQNNKVE